MCLLFLILASNKLVCSGMWRAVFFAVFLGAKHCRQYPCFLCCKDSDFVSKMQMCGNISGKLLLINYNQRVPAVVLLDKNAIENPLVDNYIKLSCFSY